MKKINKYSFINAIIISIFLHLLFFLLILNIKVLNLSKKQQKQIISYIEVEYVEKPSVKRIKKPAISSKSVIKQRKKNSNNLKNIKRIVLGEKVSIDKSINQLLEQTPKDNVFYTETADIKRISIRNEETSKKVKKQVENFELLSKIVESLNKDNNIVYDNIITKREGLYNYNIDSIEEDIEEWRLQGRAEFNYRKLNRKILYQPVPEVPQWLEKKGISTFIVFKAVVNKDGTIKNIEILKSSGFAQLDRDAILYVSRWKYEPADYEEVRYPRVIFLVRKK